MKYKIGDRIVLVINYSYYPNVGICGTVIEFLKSRENMYKVHWDEVDRNFDVFEDDLELEEIYNSPLYKLMKEENGT